MSVRFELVAGSGAPTAVYPWTISGTLNVGEVAAVVGDKTVARASASTASTYPPIGMVVAVNAGFAQIALNGDIVSGLAGLTAGSAYYLGADGAITSTKPSSNVYPVGVAQSSSSLLIASAPINLSGGSGGSGTVTSFGVGSANSTFSITGSPVTTSGTINIDVAPVGIAANGTGQTTALAAFNALSPLTTKGDLALSYLNTAGGQIRVAVGSVDGQPLSSTGGAGLTWTRLSLGTLSSFNVTGNALVNTIPVTTSGTAVLSLKVPVHLGGTNLATSDFNTLSQNATTSSQGRTATQVIGSGASSYAASYSSNSYRNQVINGAMSINQRYDGVVSIYNTATPVFPIDRFGVINSYGTSSDAGTISAQQLNEAPPGLSTCLRLSVLLAGVGNSTQTPSNITAVNNLVSPFGGASSTVAVASGGASFSSAGLNSQSATANTTYVTVGSQVTGGSETVSMPASGNTVATQRTVTINCNHGTSYATGSVTLPAIAGISWKVEFTSGTAPEAGYDYINFYAGTNTSSPLIGRWTGTARPALQAPAGLPLTVQYTSDNFTTNSFVLTATSWNGTNNQNLLAADSSFTCTPSAGSFSFVTIPANATYGAQISGAVVARGGVSVCYGTFDTGLTNSSNTLGILSSTLSFEVKALAGNPITIIFSSPQTPTPVPTGISITLGTVTTCVLATPNGTIQSPSYPSTYPANFDGYIVIPAQGANTSVLIQGTTNLEVALDYLRVYEGTGTTGTELYRFQGLAAGASKFFSYSAPVNTTVTLRFVSDGSAQYAGFALAATTYNIANNTISAPTERSVITMPATAGSIVTRVQLVPSVGGTLLFENNNIPAGNYTINLYNSLTTFDNSTLVASASGPSAGTFNLTGTAGTSYTLEFSGNNTSSFTITQNQTLRGGTSPLSTSKVWLRQGIENGAATFMWGAANGRYVTCSFWVRSSLPGLYAVGITNSDSGTLVTSYVTSYTINAPNTWEYKTVLFPPTALTGWTVTSTAYIRWDLGSGANNATTVNTWASVSTGIGSAITGNLSTFSTTTGATFDITGVQVEVGPVASAFELRPIQQELSLCQRYFIRYAPGASGVVVASGFASTATQIWSTFRWPQFMRALPTAILSSWEFTDGVSTVPATGLNNSYAGYISGSWWSSTTGATSGRAYLLRSASSTAEITFNAEL